MEVLAGRTFRFAALFLASAVLPAWAAAELEFQIKAAFLNNFGKFVEWPTSAAERPVFCIGLIGPDPFGETIDEMVKGRMINGRPVVIRRFSRLADAKLCHILFITITDRERLHLLLPSVPSGVLTIGQAGSFLEEGGMINFILEDNRVRFEVNAESARRAGLRIHSQLLKLARNGDQ